MNERHGVRMYGKEHVCTGAHLWGAPSNGFIMCELCYTCLPENQVPKWEHRTAAREAIENSIRTYNDQLRRLYEKEAQGWYVNQRELKDIRTMLTSLYKELDKWRT